MFLSVNSKSEHAHYDGGPGKTMWLNNQPKVEISRSAPEHIGAPAWHVELSLEQYIEHNNGSRSGGAGRTAVVRTAELQLTPADVNSILDALVRAGLISVTVAATDAHAG